VIDERNLEMKNSNLFWFRSWLMETLEVQAWLEQSLEELKEKVVAA
jgi:hypothetical protein